MTVFIPEWNRVSGRSLQIKRVFNALGDDWIVRRPVRAAGWMPVMFIEHPVSGWMVVSVDETPFSLLDPGQLFERNSEPFEQRLTQLGQLDGFPLSSGVQLTKLVLMWDCSSEETRILSAEYFEQFGVRLLSKEQFLQYGKELIHRLSSKLSAVDVESLRGFYFPEAEIPAVCTTRRHFNRDNSARLTRFFLDVEQEWASKLDLDQQVEQSETAGDFSVRLVNGVAGSGKTLIALNRALLLSKLFPQQNILMLIHNTPVVADIKERLHRSRGGIPENVEITTFFAWAVQQWRLIFGVAPLPKGVSHVTDLVEHYRAPWPDLKLTTQQLTDEFDFINSTLIPDEHGYLNANRAGQGVALRHHERNAVWMVYEAVTAALSKEGYVMWSAIPRGICLASPLLQQGQKYHHVLVDEAQFFAPSWFEMVKRGLEVDGQLFLCADPNQGFMKNRLSWKSVGLEVAGRTKKLRKSYRTTQAILRAANQVLTVVTKGDPDDYLEPDFEGMEIGKQPILSYVSSPQDAIDRIVSEISSAIEAGASVASILVIHGNKIDKSGLVRCLEKSLGEEKVWWLNRNQHKKRPPYGYGKDYLRIASLDTATGLEGNQVILAGLEELFSEGGRVGQSNETFMVEQEERARKLYMGMTRAGQQLFLLSSQRLPPDIERLFQVSA